MTLDEAITHALDEAEKHGRQAKKISGINMYQSGKLYQCAREHAQLAEWLEELKAYRACTTSRSFWDGKHCGGCLFYDDCPFDPKEDEV